LLPLSYYEYHQSSDNTTLVTVVAAGPLEFLFVVDGPDDPAMQPMREVVEAAKGVDARVLVSGQATSNSQKIHNLQTGIQVRQYLKCRALMATHTLSIYKVIVA
jgi:hypothetical protein